MQNTMLNPEGIFSFTWNHNYYFFNYNYSSFSEAIFIKDIEKLSVLCCLETDSNDNFINSNWPGTVKSLKQLKNHLKYIEQKPDWEKISNQI